MKLLTIITCAVIALSSCKGKKKEASSADIKTEANTPVPSTADEELTKWLGNKMLVDVGGSKDYHNFKMFADGTCEDKGKAKGGWSIKEGKLVVSVAGVDMKIPIEKKGGDIILKRALGEEFYVVMDIPGI